MCRRNCRKSAEEALTGWRCYWEKSRPREKWILRSRNSAKLIEKLSCWEKLTVNLSCSAKSILRLRNLAKLTKKLSCSAKLIEKLNCLAKLMGSRMVMARMISTGKPKPPLTTQSHICPKGPPQAYESLCPSHRRARLPQLSHRRTEMPRRRAHRYRADSIRQFYSRLP